MSCSPIGRNWRPEPECVEKRVCSPVDAGDVHDPRRPSGRQVSLELQEDRRGRGIFGIIDSQSQMIDSSHNPVRVRLGLSRWQAATGESVAEVLFMSRHMAASGKPALTLHPIGE